MDNLIIQFPDSEPCLECIHGLNIVEAEEQKAGMRFPAIVCRKDQRVSFTCNLSEPRFNE